MTEVYATRIQILKGSGPGFENDTRFKLYTTEIKNNRAEARLVFDGVLSATELEDYEEILLDRDVWCANNKYNITEDILLIAPQKFWVVLYHYSWVSPKNEEEQFEVIESKGPFKNEEEAIKQFIARGL